MSSSELDWMAEALRLSVDAVESGRGGPFGAVVVRDARIVGRGLNQVTSTNDPTAHAEIVAIRDACRTLQTFELSGCELYTSCEPCPMCLAAIYWSRIGMVYYANTRDDAAEIGFDDARIARELSCTASERQLTMHRLWHERARAAMTAWQRKADRIAY